MIKTILGYEIEPGVTPEDYERWLFDVHVPDIMANPHVDKLVFNKVLRPVRRTSDGSVSIDSGQMFYRIAEMHFTDEDAYERYVRWFEEHPIAPERTPAGRTAFTFYVLATTRIVEREPTRP